MKLRVTSSGISGGCQTSIVNADTGEHVDGVRAVRWSHDDVDDTPVLTLDVVDFDLDAAVDHGAFTFKRRGEAAAPRLMLVSKKRISPESALRLRQLFADASKRPNLVTVIEGCDVYQLVDGRWLPVDPGVAPASPEVLARYGITADTDP